LDKAKNKHRQACHGRQFNEALDPEVMTTEQQEAWSKMDCRSEQGPAGEKWKDMIYQCLFPNTVSTQVHDPCMSLSNDTSLPSY